MKIIDEREREKYRQKKQRGGASYSESVRGR